MRPRLGGQSITIQEYDIQAGDGATLQWKDSSGVLLPGLLTLGVEVKYPGFDTIPFERIGLLKDTTYANRK